MKKVLKSKIFIIVILCVISCGIGVYGASKYNSEDFTYTKEDGSEIAVNDALNELYNTKTECEKDSFCSKVKLGDYIKMIPTETSYTILSSLTGYSSNQTITPSELTLWRVIRKNDDGTIEMVSENVSSTKVYFYGQTGYLNFVGVLNLIASQYGNSKYTIDSRIMGYNGQTETITDTSQFTYPATLTISPSDNSNETLGGGDIMYEVDTNLLTEALGTLVATNSSGTATAYWIGSRAYAYSASNYYLWGGRCIVTDGSTNANSPYHYASKWVSLARENSVRPILTLKSGLTASGSGTSDDPYVLE